jgi:Asp-tRNA(Asn)/Glu-tRNA(Gln) amidotransferase A subunit family amidase
MKQPALERLNAASARQKLESGELTSEALVSACLARIAERDGEVGAWTTFNSERALNEARASDARRTQGRALSPLDGIPVGVKDIIDTKDFPTELGSEVFTGRQPDADAFIVSELKAAGAIIVGKTVTTELAFFGPGKTRNPHDLERTPGGSSSGSAAAVADRQVPLALGTQTAGSTNRPASYCGVVGFKPTFGYTSRSGVLPQSAPLDTIGGYARSVEDIALLFDAISAFDSSDLDMSPGEKPSLAAALIEPPNRVSRFAFIKTPAWPQADVAMKTAFEAFAGGFGARAEIVDVTLPAEFEDILRLPQIVQFYDIAKNYGPIADANPDRVSAKLKEIIAEGRTFSAADYAAARADQDSLYEVLRPVLADYDAILTPAAAGPALVGLAATGSPMFNALWTYLGMPCISLPLLKVENLPVGVQLVGTRGNDANLLRTASWLMQERQREA